MSNKKQVKKETPILLGIPDGGIELDNDAYITKLGGLPILVGSSATSFRKSMQVSYLWRQHVLGISKLCSIA
ncbi:unnamed protein product [Mucor hiemalis]